MLVLFLINLLKQSALFSFALTGLNVNCSFFLFFINTSNFIEGSWHQRETQAKVLGKCCIPQMQILLAWLTVTSLPF